MTPDQLELVQTGILVVLGVVAGIVAALVWCKHRWH